MNSNSIAEHITKVVSQYTDESVNLESEIYYDLGIYGEDLYDIFDILIKEYGVDYSEIDAAKIAPGEGGGFLAWIGLRLGFQSFDSFRVADLINYTTKNM